MCGTPAVFYVAIYRIIEVPTHLLGGHEMHLEALKDRFLVGGYPTIPGRSTRVFQALRSCIDLAVYAIEVQVLSKTKYLNYKESISITHWET